MELIDKAAVVAEIEKQGTIQPQLSWFTDKLIQIINDSVEVKEVDLKKEVELWMQSKPSVNFEWGNIADAMRDCAKHFFELGIAESNKAQKGE